MKAVIYGVGPIGIGVCKLALKKGINIVGAIDIDKSKVGKDLGEILGLKEKMNVIVSSNAEEILGNVSSDLVFHCTSSYLKDVHLQLKSILNAKLSVISTTEELSFPYFSDPQLAREIDDVAKKNNVSIIGTGVNPGFAMDKLVLTLTSVCQDVKKIKATRIVDASKRRLPLQKKVGAGMTVKEFKQGVKDKKIKHVGLPESVAMVEDALGFKLDTIKEDIYPVVAQKIIKTPFLKVEKGKVAGLKQIARGIKDKKTLIFMELRMYVGAKDPTDVISIEGTPPIHMKIKGGIHGDLATASMVVNLAPIIVEAKSGLLTMKDIPVSFFRSVNL
ncbi:MAG: dihydrodipicolinate reductase [Acidobacteriota bacterium]